MEDLGQDPHPRDDPGARAVATDPPRGADRLPAVVPWVLYSSYALAPGVLALTAQQDQTWGGHRHVGCRRGHRHARGARAAVPAARTSGAIGAGRAPRGA